VIYPYHRLADPVKSLVYDSRKAVYKSYAGNAVNSHDIV
jgi:hypothetical protein